MPTRADVEQFAAANRDVRKLVVEEMRALWRSLDVTDAMAVREALEDLLPGLVTAYGEMAMTVAANFFDTLRGQATPGGAFTAVPAPTADPEQVRANARWAIGPLFSKDPDPDQALGRLTQEVDRLSLQTGKDTIAISVENDPAEASWARVPVGPTCEWCRALASRGAVYRSRESAGDANLYHADCDCSPTPMWEGDSYPDGYDPDALYEDYAAAAEAAGSGNLKDIVSKMRELRGTSH